jgi:hypothetical protein
LRSVGRRRISLFKARMVSLALTACFCNCTDKKNTRHERWRLNTGRACAFAVTCPREPVRFRHFLFARSGSNVICATREHCVCGLLCEYHVYVKKLIFSIRCTDAVLKQETGTSEAPDFTQAGRRAGVQSIHLLQAS